MAKTELSFLCYVYCTILLSFSIQENLLTWRLVLRRSQTAEASSYSAQGTPWQFRKRQSVLLCLSSELCAWPVSSRFLRGPDPLSRRVCDEGNSAHMPNLWHWNQWGGDAEGDLESESKMTKRNTNRRDKFSNMIILSGHLTKSKCSLGPRGNDHFKKQTGEL